MKKIGSVAMVFALVLIMVGGYLVFSYTPNRVEKAENQQNDEIDLGKVLAEVLPGVTAVDGQFSEKERKAQSVGYSWETPLFLSVKSEQ